MLCQGEVTNAALIDAEENKLVTGRISDMKKRQEEEVVNRERRRLERENKDDVFCCYGGASTTKSSLRLDFNVALARVPKLSGVSP